MPEPKWLTIAKGELGVKEKSGKEANPRILEYFEAAGSNVSSDEVPWCSAFMCWVMEQAGYASTNNAAARSWLKYGKPTNPKPGAIAIFPRGNSEWQGHVAMVEKVTGNSVSVIGGNQGNAVTRRNMHIKSALGFRWPNTIRNSNTMAAAGMGGLGLVGTGYGALKPVVEQAQEAFPTSTYVAIAALAIGFIGFGIVVWRRYQKMKAPK